MDHIRIALSRIANLCFSGDVCRRSYREAFIEKVQYLERLEKANLRFPRRSTRSSTWSCEVRGGDRRLARRRGRPPLCAIGVDVTEEHDLAVRTRRAERLASLGTMAAGLAHEIRNPLNAAHLQLSLARRRLARSTGDEGAARAVELAGAEMARLAGLVEDFLQFARPQSLRLERADLRALAHDAAALLAPEATDLGVALEVCDGPSVVTEFDREKMKQVLLNLVRNALEAAGSGGRVRIDVQEHEGSALLTVEDNGRGFPEDSPIFEPFFTTKVGGTGLGLAIVHRIVADHGGTVTASSRSGSTTVFSVLLPIGNAARELAQ